MSSLQGEFTSSPLVIASRKARWIFDGLDVQDAGKVLLLAQAMATLIHGSEAPGALPCYSDLTFYSFSQYTPINSLSNLTSFHESSSAMFAVGVNCEVSNLINDNKGSVTIVCGNNVKLTNVTFKGNGNRNLVVICHGVILSDVTIHLNGMGLVIIGMDASINNSSFHTNENITKDCVFFKSLFVFPHEKITDSKINKFRIRRVNQTGLSKGSNGNNEVKSTSLAAIFSFAFSGKFCDELRNAEDTQEFRWQLMAKDELFHQMRLLHQKYFALIPVKHSEYSFPRVACIMMQRNERSLLQPWVEYYSDLFGASNLYIFDNGSTDESVRNYLYQIREAGVHVDFSHQSSADFKRKGVIFKKLIEELQVLNFYDFYIPLDCDEFMSIKTTNENGFSTNKNAVQSELSKYVYTSDALKVNTFFNNMPHSDTSFYFQNGRKTFFAANTIKSLDHGFHNGEAFSGSEVITGIAYVHFHNKPIEELREHSYNKLAPFFEIEKEEVLNELVEKGNRLALNFSETKESYEKRFESKKKINNDELTALLEMKGVAVPN